MRRSLIAVATAATLTLTIVPAAGAAEALDQLPADLTIGSSAADNLSSGDNSGERTLDNVVGLGQDWLMGAVLMTVAGGLINLILDAR